MGQTIGIDFGTTNTVVSFKNKKGKIICLRDKDNSKSISTALYFKTENEFVIGTEAISLAAANNVEPIVSFKSRLNEQNERYNTKAMDGSRIRITPKKATGYFIAQIIKNVQDRIMREFGPAEGFIEKAVITVPAKFSPSAKESIKDAAMEAGLNNVELIFEPTAAAAAAYQSIETDKDECTIIVYDFGGGTFDISIMKATKVDSHIKYEQVYTNGDKELGGNNVTLAIAEDILEKVNDEFDLDMEFDEDAKGLYRIIKEDVYDGDLPYDIYRDNLRNIINCAEDVKITYESGDNLLNIRTENGLEPYIYEFTIDDIEKIISPLIKRSIDITKDSLKYAEDNNITIDRIVLAGGSSNIPLVHKELEKYIPLDDDTLGEVTELISKGAVVLNENKLNEISNITSCVFGTVAQDGPIPDKFIPLIPINTALPTKVEKIFYLNSDNQEKLEVKVYEHDIQIYPKANRAMSEGIDVAKYSVINLPSGLKREDTEIKLTFIFERDGSLNIDVDIYSNKRLVHSDKMSMS